MITVADVIDVEGDILELINRLAHKDNPCRLGSSSFDNEMCQIFTGKSIQYGPYCMVLTGFLMLNIAAKFTVLFRCGCYGASSEWWSK